MGLSAFLRSVSSQNVGRDRATGQELLSIGGEKASAFSVKIFFIVILCICNSTRFTAGRVEQSSFSARRVNLSINNID